MKRQKRSAFVLLALIVALMLAAGPVAAEATVTEFTGTETLVDVLHPGHWTSPGGRMHVRGRVLLFNDVTTDPRTTGMNTVVLNANWDANFVGRMWGTFRVEAATVDGYWEGTWSGMMYADGSSLVRTIAHGGGAFEGLIGFATIENGQFSGTILHPHGE